MTSMKSTIAQSIETVKALCIQKGITRIVEGVNQIDNSNITYANEILWLKIEGRYSQDPAMRNGAKRYFVNAFERLIERLNALPTPEPVIVVNAEAETLAPAVVIASEPVAPVVSTLVETVTAQANDSQLTQAMAKANATPITPPATDDLKEWKRYIESLFKFTIKFNRAGCATVADMLTVCVYDGGLNISIWGYMPKDATERNQSFEYEAIKQHWLYKITFRQFRIFGHVDFVGLILRCQPE